MKHLQEETLHLMNSKPKSGLISRQSSQLKPRVVVVVAAVIAEGEGQRPRDLKWNSHQFRLQESFCFRELLEKVRLRKIVVSISCRVKYVLIYLATHWTLTFTQTTELDASASRWSSKSQLRQSSENLRRRRVYKARKRCESGESQSRKRT